MMCRVGKYSWDRGWGDAGEAGIQLRWDFPMVHIPRREGNVVFPLLSWLGLELSDRERKDKGEAGWDTHREISLLEHLNCPT